MSPTPHPISEEVPDLGPVPHRLTIEVETVRQLVEQQFPQWSHLTIAPVRNQGWDNFTFQLGDEMAIRLPSAEEYALAVEKEHRWLPEIATQVPVPIPLPLGLGQPGSGYPFRWSIYTWLPGEAAEPGSVTDPVGLAEDVSDFLGALRGLDASGGPQPGVHNWFRGATLRTYDASTRSALTELGGHLDPALARAAWEDALAARWDGVDVWFHGDFAPANLLLDRGRLNAVIDFGTCGVGDPSCDLAIAWTLLTPDGRQILRDRLSVDAPTWSRGRGWALWKSLVQLAGAVEDEDDASVADALLTIEPIIEDYRANR
ncbi:MAG: aminoglycoside phosphotransferase [Nocardioides sp.]|nr:aminoglycoside phosphotransferase [Nocardioides sp.]